MNIVLITHDEPFYLAKNINYLLENLPSHSKVTGCVVLSPSPYGRRKSFFQKSLAVRNNFGDIFFLYYTFLFIKNKFNKETKVLHVLEKHRVDPIFLDEAINSTASIEKIRRYNPDLLISIQSNEIFKKPIIRLAPKGCLNLHTALLPKYRGVMPTFWVLKNKERETGVSTFYVDEGIDTGDIIVQKKIPIEPGTTQAELITLTKKIGMEAIIESINLINDNAVVPLPNNEKEATYYSMPTREDVKDFLKSKNRFF